jgi:hypothetical protein
MNRMLTQTRGAAPYRGVLCVSSRYCSCWKRHLGGRTFSADPALACQRFLTQFYSLILPTNKGTGDSARISPWALRSNTSRER